MSGKRRNGGRRRMAATGQSDAGAKRAGSRAAGSYDVGYRKPPKASRFKPGVSGNPSGRPKGSKNQRTLITDIMNSKIVRREGDKTTRNTVFEGLVLKQVENGLKGNERSFLALCKLCSSLGMLDKAEMADVAAPLSPIEQRLIDQLLSKASVTRGED